MSMVNIDDTDPSIVWTGHWEMDESPDSPAYNHTSAGSKKAGETALVTFTGTSIIVYGTLTHGLNTSTVPISQYMLDNSPDSTPFTPFRPVKNLYNQTFFKSPVLPYGTHQLKIVDMTTTDTGLWLDLFVVTTGPDNSSTTPSPTQSITPPPTESAGPTPKAHSNIRIIAVSIVVGGCMLLAAFFLIVYFTRRRRVKQNEQQVTQTAEPFLLQPPPQDHVLSLESSYRHSGMYRNTGLNASFSVQRSYDMSRSAGEGSQIDDFAAQPPMYTKR